MATRTTIPITIMSTTGTHSRERHEVDTGHGRVALEVFEDGVPPRWRLTNLRGSHCQAEDVTLTTERTDGRQQVFLFVQKDGYLESLEQVPEPHEFMARLALTHGGRVHSYDVAFLEPDNHQHDHSHEPLRGLDVAAEQYQDAHQLAHANDIRRRFANRNVTNWQIALFGLTGGLIPCPAAITVLLLCLQLKEFTLGAVLVLCFSIGLAITLVTVGAVAALSVRHVTQRAPWFSAIARRAPYLSSVLIIAVGIYVGAHGWLDCLPPSVGREGQHRSACCCLTTIAHALSSLCIMQTNDGRLFPGIRPASPVRKNTGKVIASNSERVAPPMIHWRVRLCPYAP